MFDIKLFSKKSEKFPGEICFPQYFAYAITSVFNNFYYLAFLEKNKDIENLCYAYFDFLPIIIKQIYGNKYKIDIDENKLYTTVNVIKTTNDVKIDYLYLEYYLKDENSVRNYRKALLENTLKFHDFENINQFIEHLLEIKVCFNKQEDLDSYPPSNHYVISAENFENLIINTKLRNIIHTSKFWGPFYWNIFHSVTKKSFKEKNNHLKNKLKNNYLKNKLIDFIYILPFTLPCNVCTDNYLEKMPYFNKIIDIHKNNKNHCTKQLYEKIHDKVNYETY